MTEINQTIDINELSAMRVDELPLLTFKDRQNNIIAKLSLVSQLADDLKYGEKKD